MDSADSRSPTSPTSRSADGPPAHPAARERTVLKSNARRSVWLERRDEDGGEHAVVVKRFHHPGLFYRLRDRARARAEHALLGRLHAAGVNVPRPRAVRPAEHGWQVEMDWIPGAVSWLALLGGPGTEPAAVPAVPARAARSERLSAALGRLLARLHELGVDHADLHPGNVLITPDGEPWAIDFHKSRLRAELGPDELRRDLVALAAGVRERVDARFRARALAAWSRALPTRLRALLPPNRTLAAEVEDAARFRRRAEVRASARRWTRESASCRVVELERGRAFLARPLPDDFARALAATGATPTGPRAAHVLRAPLAALLPRWFTAVRLLDHGVPALRPLCLVERPEATAAFEPGEACSPADLSAPGLDRELGALLGALHDRGLAAAVGPADLFADAEGRLRFGPSLELLDFDPRPSAPEEGRARFGGLAPELREARCRPAFRAAYAGAFRGGLAERERLRAELEQ